MLQGHGAVRERARAPGPHSQQARRPGVTRLHPAVPAQGPAPVAGLHGERMLWS